MTRYQRMWRVDFGDVTSYDRIASNIDAAIRSARAAFNREHSFREPITEARLIGKAVVPTRKKRAK